MASTVYKITNTTNKDFYIGATTRTINNRFAEHKYKALRRNSNSALHKAMRKFGVENFDIEVLEVCENAFELEEDLINDLNPAYNTGCAGEHNGRYGKITSEETKRKISLANKGNQPRLGVKLSEESKMKISKSQKARYARLRGDDLSHQN